MSMRKTHRLVLLLLFIFILTSNTVFADEDEGGSAKIGPDQAITKVDHDQGIQLSDIAIRSIGIRSQALSTFTSLSVPTSALVYFQDRVGVFRLRNSWFKLVEVKVQSKATSEARITSVDLMRTDEIVFQGAPLLRVAHIEASEGQENGHED